MSEIDTALIPFTSAQRLVWLGQRLNPGVPLYNMALSFELPTYLDVERFRQAWDALIGECELLRSAMHDDAAQPGLVAAEPNALEVHDDLDEAESDRIRREAIRSPFASGESLTRSILIRHSAGHFEWLLVQHHLVTDLASFFVVFNQVAAKYAGGEESLHAFRDYVGRETALRVNEKLTAARDALVRETDGYEPIVDFYDIDPRTPSSSNSRTIVPFSRTGLSRDAAPAFGQDLRDYATFLTALVTLLHRRTGQRLVTIGVPLHNRTNAARKSTIGMLVEIVPITVEIDSGDSLKTVQSRVTAAFALAMAGGSTGLVDETLAGRFDVVLNYLQVPDLAFDGSDVACVWHHCNAADPAHALRLHVWRTSDDAFSRLLFDMRNDTFNGQRQSDFEHAYLNAVKSVVADSEQRAGDVRLLGDEALARISTRALGPRFDAPNGSLVDSIRTIGTAHSERVAMTQGTEQITFGELLQRVQRKAASIQAAGVRPGQPIVVWRNRSVDALIDILGCLFAGGAFVPVEATTPLERVRGIVADLAAGGGTVPAFVDTEVEDRSREIGLQLIDTSQKESFTPASITLDQTCYVLYTSGSTGRPKGVVVSHGAIYDYVLWAARVYEITERDRFGLFTSLGFDLTLTSLFLPLVTGTSLTVFPPAVGGGADLAVADAARDSSLTFAKITPSHLTFWTDELLANSAVRCWVVGGEQFTVEQAERLQRALPSAAVFNEYGPTEAAVACMLHRYSSADRASVAVPVGLPADNHVIHVLDDCGHPVSDETTGEIYIGGAGLADGYLNRPEETAERFVQIPGIDERLYRTGDMARWNSRGTLEFLGRRDSQIKLSGIRFELTELDNLLLRHPGVSAAVSVTTRSAGFASPARHCESCGLPDNYPNVTFDDSGVCSVCRRFDAVRSDVQTWFRTPAALEALAADIREHGKHLKNDCAVLFSGGKDSTYMVYQLVSLGLRPVALSLDNGYLSGQAHDNIRKVVADLGIDHHYLRTEHMNRIFADSLERFSNVCHGCFKTIYSLSMQYADENGIGTIFTGLSRGQLFETRLDDLFHRSEIPVARYDELIMDARKVYHRMDDAPGQCLSNGYFDDDACFDRVRFEDFYRYIDVPLAEVYQFLEQDAPWARPTDTGRSTNCLINDAGIYVHREREGYHNYALPYAWDVRLGHKTRDQAIDELRDRIDRDSVARTLKEIGFSRTSADSVRVRTWIVADDTNNVPAAGELRDWLSDHLPANLLPDSIVAIDALPLTANGKVDTAALVVRNEEGGVVDTTPPREGDEALLAECWARALGRDVPITRGSNFFSAGGDSMAAILLVDEVSRVGRSLSLEDVFAWPLLHDMSEKLGSHERVADDDFDFGLSLDEDQVDDLIRRNHPGTS